jgi:hypothetical protein
LSTLTDLFNIRIGFSKRVVLVEKLVRGVQLLRVEERLPLREGVRARRFHEGSLEDIFESEGVTKEDIYYIIPPDQYYKNTLHFPFSERQKIEAVVKHEVSDYLPTDGSECLTDFYLFGEASSSSKARKGEVLAFTVEKEKIRMTLEEFGRFRENLKAVVPLDIAVFFSIREALEAESFILLDLQDDAAYIQATEGDVLKNAGFIVNGKRYEETLRSQLLMLAKTLPNPVVYTNTRRTVNEELREMTVGVLEETGLAYRNVPSGGFDRVAPDSKEVDVQDSIAFFGLLKSLNEQKLKSVNLLKEEFKPKMKGYVSIKEFTILGILLLLLLSFSTANLMFDLNFKKDQISSLNSMLDQISMKYFNKPGVSGEETKQLLGDVQIRIKRIQNATDRRFSCTQILKEFTSSLPVDVDVEYTDIIVERNHIKFLGKTETFSDIDRIKESLVMSDLFSSVEVSNTGTTGSTEGFAVTFIFDIDVVEE